MGCYDGIWKCRNRLPTIGKETIFEYSAWQLMRVEKSMIFKNIVISIGGKAISEICTTLISNIMYFQWWRSDFRDCENSDFH